MLSSFARIAVACTVIGLICCLAVQFALQGYADTTTGEEGKTKGPFHGEVGITCDNTSTALDIVKGHDLSTKHFIVTGADSGIGYEVTRVLSRNGGHVVMACRNESKAHAAKRALQASDASANIEVMLVDLASLASVREFASEYKSKNRPLHALILNAGVLQRYEETADALDATFQVNYLAHFYLTQLLKDELLMSQPSRVVLVASGAHGRIKNLQAETLSIESLSLPAKNHEVPVAYGIAKLCNVLFAKQIRSRWGVAGLTSLSVHPGDFIATNIFHSWEPGHQYMLAYRPYAKSKEQAAASVVFCAVARGLERFDGEYFEDSCVTESSPLSGDTRLAAALWDLSMSFLRARGFI